MASDDKQRGDAVPDARIDGAHDDSFTRSFSTWVAPFLVILGLATAAFLLSYWLDLLTPGSTPSTAPSVHVSQPASLFMTLWAQDVEQARNTLGGLGEVMAAVLGLALTVSSIIVQLAATRFTPYITTLFFRARTNLLVLGFFVTSSVYVLWVNFSVSEQYLPRFGVLFSMLAMTLSLLLLFPYFAYVFAFLDPTKIVARIMTHGLSAAVPGHGPNHVATQVRQRRAIESIEQLANIGLNAIQQKDKGIASGSVDALCSFGIRYGQSKSRMSAKWHAVPPWNRQSPDFVSLSDEAVSDLELRGTWLEWKLLRQYQMLFGEALGHIKDTCYLIAIDTRRLGEAAGDRADLHALDLSVKFFNTYLRAAINVSDIRTAYNVLHQYRQLAEFILDACETCPEDLRHALSERAVQVAKFMRYYSRVCSERGLTFVSEVIAHDIGSLCAFTFARKSEIHDELLRVFLAVDEHAETQEQEKTLRGVRRAQVKLATTYLLHGAEHHARAIFEDMQQEPPTRLRGIWQELESLRAREFWEVNDRGTNFDYLTPHQKLQLERFFGWFPGLERPAPRKTYA